MADQNYKLVAVRYQVKDTERAVEFYTKHLGFALDRVAGPVGLISNNGVQIWLSGPGSSGSRDLPNGETQEPGGSNRIALQVSEIESPASPNSSVPECDFEISWNPAPAANRSRSKTLTATRSNSSNRPIEPQPRAAWIRGSPPS